MILWKMRAMLPSLMVSTNHIISDLRRDVSYIIIVNATNSVGTSSSDIVTVQTEGEKLVYTCTDYGM